MTTTVVSQTSNSGFLSGGGSIEGMFGVSNTAPFPSSPVSVGTEAALLALGRMVNLPRDVFVSLLLGTDGQWHVFVTDAKTEPHTTIDAPVPTGLQPVSSDQSSQAVVLADFDGDGYVEALIAYLGQTAAGQLQGAMRIVRPVDVNDLGTGMTFGPEVLTTSAIGLPLSTLKTGDLNGDGLPEIISFNGATLSVSTVDPTTSAIDVAAATFALPGNASVAPFNLMTGRFRNTLYDEVAVVGQLAGGPRGVTL